MYILIFIIGLIIGSILNIVIEIISSNIAKNEKKSMSIIVSITCGIAFEILFLRLGVSILFFKAIVMSAILIIISFVDLKHRIIPDFMVVIALIIGVVFSFISKASLIDTLLGMISGGGILFILSLIPNAMGGGDIKLMFAIGSFLGVNRTLWALILAFIISSIVSVVLLILKIKGTKDYIPFGPFLSLGSFISILIAM